MLRGYKLDPTLISALVERWRPTFHLPCEKCTITHKDVALQLDLPVDRSVVMGLVVVPGKEDLCETFLGKVSNKFYGGRIDMKWLETNFKYLPKDVSNVVKEQYVQAFILRLAEGIPMPDNSQNLVHIRWLLHLVDFKESRRLITGLVATTISMSSSEQSIYFPIGDKVEPLVKLRGTTRAARKDSTIVRSILGSRCVVDSVRDGGDARIRLSDATIRVEATNSIATVRHGSIAQAGSAGEERREFTRLPQEVEVRSRQLRLKRQRRATQQHSVTNTHRVIILSGWVIGATTFSWIGGHKMEGRTTPHSSTKEGNRDKDKDEVEGGNEDEDDDRDKDELKPLVMRRNPACTR
ncbi:hypothetical protein Gotri_026246 [Gossypium trilobum]|uniref:Aminotransferase-like plant mobile domain-containing protein n=1 Tax=Gossypium trilobum TaxID=34281 RepID=A0A7J9FPB4_9ROSI|nr:hypothetical protein [Gossypium trilobum]